jgi:low affinity Fe/Cu permease
MIESGYLKGEGKMTLTCNIDSKGAKLRRVWGIMALFMAALLGGLAYWSETWWLWIVVAVAASAGIFALFEAQKKWCAVRAMGIKTRV